MELTESAAAALRDGHVVRESHLAGSAGMPPAGSVKPVLPRASEEQVREADLERSQVVEALKRCEGRVATAARELGVHRNQLRRWLEKHKVDPKLPG